MLDGDDFSKTEDFDLMKKDLLQKLLDEALSSNIVKISRAQKRTQTKNLQKERQSVAKVSLKSKSSIMK